ncbi:MAG: HD domain-containing protein [Negativicutes bacterium]|jgi:putative nucleotidyltransferase with HDIG domain
MSFPTREQAQALLVKANQSNPGPWYDHSQYAGKAAELIGRELRLDANKTYVAGLLHDIGRYEGPSNLRHVVSGFRYLQSLGFGECARYTLTHSFFLKDLNSFIGVHDVNDEERVFLEKYLLSVQYDDYDYLFQLCDALALPDGFCIVEQRIVDVTLRHGLNEYSLEKWRAMFAIKADFEKRIGKSVYALLPGIAERIIGQRNFY